MATPYQPAKAWIEKDGSVEGEKVSPNQHWPVYYENKRLEERIEIVDQYFSSYNYDLWVPHCPSGSAYFDSSHQLSVSMGWGQGSCWTGNTPNPNYGYTIRPYYYRGGWGASVYPVLNHWAVQDGIYTNIYATLCNGAVSLVFWFDIYNYRGYVAYLGPGGCGGNPYAMYATASAGVAGWNLIEHPQYPGMRGMPWNHGVRNKYVSTVFDLMYWEDYGRGSISKIDEWRDEELLIEVTPGSTLNPTIPTCLANAQPVIPCPPTGHIYCGDDPAYPAPGNYCCLNCEQTASKLRAIDSKMKGVSSAAAGKVAQLDAAFKKIAEMWDEI
jgi:hypothetical protein